MMNTIFEARSTNGRWGIAVLGPEGTRLPAQGRLMDLGEVAQIRTFRFVPDDSSGQWVWAGDDAEVVAGARVVADVGLQSHRRATVIIMGPEAIIRSYGYKRRSESIVAFVNGQEQEIPAQVLASMGLIPGVEAVEVEPPPPLEGPMAAAFRKWKVE